MKYLSGGYMYLLWLAPLAVCFFAWAYIRNKEALEHLIEKDLVKDLAANFSPMKWAVKRLLVSAGIFFIALALLRPSWGFVWEEVRRKGLDILIALDTSKSMLAEDVKPDRLARSKLAIKDLVKKLGGDRLGLIAFAGTAFLQCPLTVDYNGFLMTLDDININTIPRGGTSITSAIREAVKSYKGGQKKYKILILISDGEDHEGSALKEAEAAKKEGIVIFCIGIGTQGGELIPVPGETGKNIFLKDRDGKVVKTKLDEELLKKIAIMTGGSYVRSTPMEFGLDLIYKQKLAKFEKDDIKNKMKKHYVDRFQLPLLAGFILLFLEIFVSDRRARNA